MKKHFQMIPILAWCWLVATVGGFAQNPVANYTFSGNAKDQSGNGNDAAVNGALLTQDRFGWAKSAFRFDGVQSYLLAANSAVLNSDYTTVSFWINVNKLPGQGEAYLLSFGGWQERWKISLPPHGKLVWTTNGSSGISDMDAGDANALSPGAWRHLVFVHDGAKDLIYIDGVKVAEKMVSGALNSTTKPLGIGYNPIDVANYFDGDLDEVEIFSVALTAQQIADLYAVQSAAPNMSQQLVASYPFSNNTLDESGFGNSGQATDLAPATDRFGYGYKAFRFNGASSEVTADNSAKLNSDNATVGFWINPRSLPGNGEAYLLSNGGWQERWKISLPGHGKVVFTTNSSSGISDMDAGGGNELKVGVWSYVVAVHDGTNDKIFINGVLANSKAVGGALNGTTKPFGIGYNPIDGGSYFDGVLDDIQIYNYAFSDQQVAAEYAAQANFPGILSDLAAEYAFTGNLNDGSQFKNHAWNGGATPAADRFGYAANAYHLDGQATITAANSEQLNSDYATVSFWVKPDELPASGEVYLLSNGGWQERWKLSLPSHGKVVFTTNYENGISDMDAGGGHELVVGQWQHIVAVHNGSSDKIFINGVLANEKTGITGKLHRTGHPFGIGFNPIDMDNYFKGSLDDIQVYNRALDDLEVADLYAQQSQAPNYTDELVANYTFDGNADDQTPFHNNAQSSGALLASDRFGQANHAYALNGSSDEITAANSPQLNSDYATVSFWINVKALPGNGEAYLLSFGGWQERWKISLPPHGKVVWTTNASSGISDMDAGDGNELPAGQWKHVVMVHDGAKDKIFIDGVLKNEKGVAGTLNSTTHPLGMGYNPIDGGSYFNGSLDDVQLYNRALSDAEVADLFAQQSQTPVNTDTEAPGAPLDLKAAVTFNNVDLSWQPATDNVGVVAYNVFQDGAKIQTTPNTAVALVGLTPLTEFTFGVTAVDAAGNESLMTTLKATTDEDQSPDVTPPTKPGNLAATTGAHSVLLSWEASVDDRKVAGYVVRVDGAIFDTLPGASTSALVGGLDAETPYTFEVYAFDPAGNNSDIAEITVSTDKEIDTGEPGLVAWYPFEGNANDATPYANHGVIGGNPVFEPVTHPNGSGMAIKFDGNGDSVLAPNAVQLISDYATVSFWIRVDNVNIADAEAYILDFGHWNQRWKVSLPQHLKIVWTTNSKNAQFPNFISDMDSGDGNEMVKGFWWYVTMVHDGTNDIIFVNGQQANIKPAAGILNTTGRSLGMGNNPVEGGQYFNGALDELKIYNKALTGGEIEHLFQTGTTGTDEYLSADLLHVVQDVFPNPATDRLLIRHSLDGQQPLLLRVFDIQGRQIDAVRFDQHEVPAGLIPLDVRRYAQGQYFLNVVLGGKSLGSIKFNKQ